MEIRTISQIARVAEFFAIHQKKQATGKNDDFCYKNMVTGSFLRFSGTSS